MESNSIIQQDLEEIIKAELPWYQLYGRTILITGANGFLAAYIVKTLLYLNSISNAEPILVIGIVRNLEKAKQRFHDYRNDSNLKLVQLDIIHPPNLDESIDYIIHAASQASPKYYGVDPVGTIEANTIGTYNLLKFASTQSLKSFLYFSSGEVYGIVDESNIPMRESDYGMVDPTEVRSCYAESKRMGENLCVSFYHQFQVPAKIVRPFHTYGPGMALDDGRVFADFVANVVQNSNIQLHSDGQARRPFCYIKDATIGFLKLLLEGENGQSYNLGNPSEEYSILELAQIMTELKPELNLKVEINREKIQTNMYLKSPINRNSPNIDKIKKLGWTPSTDVRIGFRKTIDSYLL